MAVSVSSSDVWKDILGATPSRFDVTFASPASAGIANNQRAAVEDSYIIINSAVSLKIRAYCTRESISIESFALGVLRRSLRSYSHESFAVGLYHEGNIVLIPFVGGEDGGRETLQAIQSRWEHKILPRAATPYSVVKQLGYGCNVVLAINTSVDSKEANADLYVTWSDSSSGDGKIQVSFKSGIGPWPGIEDRFQHIVGHILAGTPSSSSSSPDDFLLLPQERAQVLEWGTGAKDTIRNCCLHELVEEQARIRPDAIALMNNCGRDKMTYRELNAKAHRLAVELQKRGAKPNSFVGILMGGEKTFEMCVAVLGVLKSGAAYVPMDAVLFPAERIKFIAEDTHMKLMVTVGEYADVLEEGEFEMMLVEEVMLKRSNDELALERDVKPEDCAYMIYTSGTTGTPKGVVCNHLGPVNMMFYDSGVEVFSGGVPGEDVVGCAAPHIFDMFVYGYFGALGIGLTLSLDIKCVTIFVGTPSMADVFLSDKTNDIKVMLVGGEAAIQGLDLRVKTFINGYGPTEASMMCTGGNSSDTIGNPLPNTLCYVVHPDDGTLCPPSVSGELWIGGIGVSKGYHNRQELTAEKFIPDPFAKSGRVYKTGDRVKWNEDGELVYLGRFDDQVKVRGYRIELGEIQAELERQEGVKGAVVVVHDENIVAFVASNLDDSLQNDALADAIKTALESDSCRLPSYMIPSLILVLEELPLTRNGKIDKKVLMSQLEGVVLGKQAEYVAPVTAEEVEMINQWQALLRTDRNIGMNDDFHDLGGHSILAMKLAATLECDVRLITLHPTPASLLACLQSLEGDSSVVDYASLKEADCLTKAEQLMLFIQLNNPNETTYNLPYCVQFDGDIDLLANVRKVVGSLPILRTRFVNGKALEDADVSVDDLTGIGADSSDMQRILYFSFDMEKGPLCRFGVDRNANILYGCIHHSIADGRSMQILLEAIAAGEVKNETRHWSVRKYAAYEALPEVIAEQQASVERYVEMLGDTPARLEVDFAVPDSYHRSSITLDSGRRAALEAYCRQEKISLFSFALGVMRKLLRAYSRESFAIGTAYNARPSQFHNTVGMFVNTVLIPFGKGVEARKETLKELNDRWSRDILPLARTPYDLITAAGYGCNVYLTYNIGIFDTSEGAPKMQPLPKLEEENAYLAPGAKLDLTLDWIECNSCDGSIQITFESGIGPWPGIEDRFLQMISRISLPTPLPSLPLETATTSSVQCPAYTIGRRGGIKRLYSSSLIEVASLTRAEQRMVFIQSNNPNETTYNIPCCVQFAGDIDLLANARKVVDSLPILSTRFVNGKALEDAVLSVDDLTGADSSEIQRILYCSFDMTAGPLCRFGVDRNTNILYACIHHSIADCTSLQILLEAIASGKVKNETRHWSVRRYAACEALPEVIAEQQASVERYVEMLGDTPARLEVDFAVPDSYHRSTITLDSGRRAALEAYCRQEKISLFSFALGVMRELLRAYNRESFAIGTAYNARPSQFHDTVGMFVNTVLIPFGKGVRGGEETWKELNDRWRNEIRPLAATPYDMITAAGYGCNVYLNYNVGIMDTSEGSPKMQPLPKFDKESCDDARRAMFDLAIAWSDSSSGDGSIQVSFESGIGPWPGIEDRFQHIITQINTVSSSSSSSPLPAMDDLLPQERAQVLEWGTGAKDPIRECCLHELVEEQARIRPDAVALMNNCGRDKMTYRELDAKAHRLAVELQKRGAQPNSFVGILMGGEKTFEMCVAVLGVLKSGAAYVPMDAVLFPAERIKFIAEDTHMKLMVTMGEYADVVEEGEFEMMLVEEVMEKRSNDELALERDVKPEDCAYMIYTSGTTGTPKGVVCNHLGPVNMIFYDTGVKVISAGVPGVDVVGCGSPPIFDMFLQCFFGSLGSGLTLSLDIRCCTILICTPSLAGIALNDATNNIKAMDVGGETCIQGLESNISTFVNSYGPTEASIMCTAGIKPNTIGNPLPNTLCYVVHPDDGTLCPPGVSGELWVGGIGVSKGYHNRPELTAEKFIPNPFSNSGRVYKTGDRVKWNEDGELVYLGRFDDQVKVRGYRIELGEIQAELEKLSDVERAAVVVHDENIVVFVASGMDDSLQNDALVEHLMAELKSDSCRLPSYMIPSRVLVLEELPLTRNGKIDKKVLMSQLEGVVLGKQAEYVAPVTEEEVEMINQWQALLGTDRNIGMNDDFHDLGGHSILAMKLAATLECDVRLITLHPTPASLLAHLQSLEGDSSRFECISLKEADCLTKAEQLMVFIQLNNPDETTYNITSSVQFDGDIDLLANVRKVVDSLPILRTRFVNGKALEDADVSVDDLTGADSSDIQRILYCSFDMTAGPLCRFGVDRNTNILYACIHHSIADGRSMQILLEAIAAGEVKNETRDWSVRRYAAYEALPEVIAEQQVSVERYVEMLGDTPARLEVDFAVPDSYHRSSITLDSGRRAALEAYCRQEKISLFSFALGVMRELLRAYNRESFAIGTAYDARPSQFHNTVGMFVNTVLIPFGKGVEARKETLKELNDRWSRDILPLARTPYDLITAAGYGCNVFLTYNVGIMDTSEGSPKMQPLPKLDGERCDDARKAKFDFKITWSDTSSGDGSVAVSFESGIGPWPGLEDRFQHIIGLILNTLSSSSSSPLPAIDILLPQERAQVLEWGTGAEDPIRECCLHELVEEQARIRPNAIALMNNCGRDKMTYRELNAKAHRLAVELQKRGAKPNSFVGILMGGEKTFEMCVAVLGVLKSGAAYVPMDAVLFPAERIKFIAEDTHMKLMVTMGEYADVVEEGECEMMLVEEVMEKMSNDELALERDVKPEDCAYMIYTSGTTGTPKGVVKDHFGPVNIMLGMDLFSGSSPETDVVGFAASFLFDPSVRGFFGSLGRGVKLSLDMKFCTMIICTPSVASIYIHDETNKIKAMQVTGEACLKGLESTVPSFMNSYGVTEIAMSCTTSATSENIGRPLPNTILYVVHPDDGTLCPPGVSGELWVGGIGVSKGYHNRPELTAEKFIPNPFSNSGRVYKTGDRVKWNEDGELVYLGRFDDQVKVRGYRIELGEIQAELEKLSDVERAAVVVHDENIVVFVASGMDDSLQNDALADAVMAALKSNSCRLPSYMIPSRVSVLEELPLTRNGKIDKKILMSQLEGVVLDNQAEYVAPVTAEEVEMINQWQALLGTDRNIGMNDDFHDLGGHSILAMKLAATLECDVRLITLHPTPASLLAHLQSLEGDSSRFNYGSLLEVASLTRTEQRMLFIQLNNPNETTYNIPYCVQFDGDIDLLANVRNVVDSLPILRTRFVNGKALEDADVSVDDLTGADSSDIQRILYCSFDMTAGPLCRFGVDRNMNILYACIHHSITDGRSMQILLEAIAAGEVKNETRDWSVRRYAAYEALPEVIAEQQVSVERYVEMLGDTPARLEVDFAVPDSYHRSSITLDSGRRAALEAYCRQEKISLFSFALGVMHEAMRAYSHESFAIGTAYDARPSQFHDTVGMFVNTVLIPFGKGVEARKETLKELNDRWSRDILPLARTPYDMITAAGYGCNVYLTYNVGIKNTSEGSPKMQPLPTLDGERCDDARRAKFDFKITWSDSSSGDGSVAVSFESGIGPWPGIEDRFQHIICLILNRYSLSSYPPSAIDILLPQERAQVLEWGTGAKDPIRNCCLHELVEEQARIRPDAVSLMNNCGRDKMTYGELDAKAHRLAVELQKRGAKPNSFVGILMGGEKTFEVCVAVLGVLKSGAAYVPMDAVLFPAERIKFIAEDTNMKLIVTVGEYDNVLEEGEFEMMLVEEVMEKRSNDELALLRDVKPEDCAYMIYTSGTTGTPKGVVCNHLGPVNIMLGMDMFPRLSLETDVVGFAARFLFDPSVRGFFGTLGRGLKLSLDMKFCTMIICTPSVAGLLIDDETNNIKAMQVTGEACLKGLESKVSLFMNSYGPTEISMICTTSATSENIGRPLPNTLCYVVHPDDGTLCPPGVSGELWVGGIGVSKGYHKRPELTAEKFIPNPFSNSGRVYKTGDRVKWNEDGELVYLGRFDDQVKVRGYRVELGEIQAELEKLSGVERAAVVVHDENIVAFVASNLDDSLQNDALANSKMAALKSNSCRLPSYMIPSRVLVLEELPLTRNGKIDKKVLMSQLEGVVLDNQAEYVAPVTEEEVEMINQWQALLGTDRNIGMNDDFHDLGGHSILAMKLAAALECDVRLITLHPTPASLLAHLQSLEGDSSRFNYASLKEVASLTKAEQRMLFIQLNNPNETTYNIPYCVQFDGDIDLLANVRNVVDSLPILRTRFVNGKALEDADVSVDDLTGADSSDIQRILYCSFDMTAGPLCRFGADRNTNILYACIHHSIADGRSMQILLKAIAAGEVKNETMHWSVRRYAAYEALPEVIVEQQVSVERYVEMLGDTPARLEVDFAVSDSYHRSSITLDSGRRAALEAYCRQEKISLFSFALGVMHEAMRAYSHESFAIGTAYDARPSQFHNTVGMFVNTVLIPFGKGVEARKETLKELNDRWSRDILPLARTPYDMITAAGYGCNVYLTYNVGIKNTSEGSPKMQPLPEVEDGNSEVARKAKFDLAVTWLESSSGDGSVAVSFESGIGPWPGLEDRFQHIIGQILNRYSLSSYPLPAMDILLPQERAQVLEWGTGAKDPIRECCLHELVEEQARIRPDAVALMNNCGRDKMTYGELDAKAHRLAVELQKRGAKPNSFVGILMGGEKTFEMCVAVLGVLKSGAAYVPMDAVLFPAERIKFIAEDTLMKLIVTVGEYDNVVDGEFEMMLVEEVMEKMSNDELALEREGKPEDCAYMIYTSGTTGTPKGVVCNHLGPVNMMFYDSGIEVFSGGIPGEDVVGCNSTHIFDMFVLGYFLTLGCGLTLSLDMKCLTMLMCTPSVADTFLLDKLNNIKAMFVGGEAAIQGLQSRVKTFINGYGPTEASIWCTGGNSPDTIGNPLPNTILYVVHPDDGTLCPLGVSGELWVGGIGVSKGYHNRPELTAEKFIPNPFSNSGKVYKTGDRVKWNEDGELVYLGRFDDQVKVRGYRIELGEIQAELEKLSDVERAAVVVHDENIVVFVASGMDDSLQNDALVEHLMAELKSDSCRLPSYMIPSRVLVLEELPLTRNGKIDKKVLMSQLEGVVLGNQAEYVAPVTEEEVEMINQWQALLGTDRNIGMNDDFHDLGGHSILAMKLAATLECDVRLITLHPTPASLLAHLQSLEGDSSRFECISLKEADCLTKAEQLMVFIQLNNPDETTYNITSSVQFDGDIDLLANVRKVVDSLPILRTRFVNGKALEDADVSVDDLTGIGADSSDIQRILYCSFDMEKGPLCRFGVDRNTNILYACIHHSITDGRSMQILLEAIAAGEVKNETRDWSVRRYAAYEALPEVIAEQQVSVERYVEMLGDTPARLEVDFAVPESYHRSSITLDSGRRAALEAYCRQEKISLFSFALGVMRKLLRAYSRESFAIGTAYNARPSQFHDTVGMFVNTVLIPFGKGVRGGEETLKELNDRWSRDILPLARTPYDLITAAGYGCNVYLTYNVGIMNTSEGSPKMQPLPKLEEENAYLAPRAKLDLSLYWSDSSSGDGSVAVSFESGIGPWPGIEDRFQLIIGQIFNRYSLSSSSPPSAIDSLLPQERAQVLEWGTGAKDPIRNCCLHELVEEQARIRPDAIALMNNCGRDKMTYGELDSKAHRLAVELQKRGAKPNSFVGILMGGEKTFEMCVAVLGVLKSGAAYVPMDAVLFPAERIKFIAEDTHMKLMVTMGEYADVVEEGEFEMMLVEEVMEKMSNDELALERDVKPEDCAYMIYTSGTTGTPKGVVCNHLGPVNMIFYDTGVKVISAGVPGVDVVGCGSPPIFDMFLQCFFGSLGSGLTLSLDIRCCTILICTPSLAGIALNDATNNIKAMDVGGETCIQGLESNISTFVNSYGPTEASIMCTAGIKPNTIGNPLPNTLCYVVHPDDGTLCPPGVSGELWVGGIGVSKGYHNRPELTAEKFIPNPFSNSGRVYKTGDRVKWNEDGELVYLGRFDDQVKVRGYRIELGEIQAELERQEGVKGAVVVVHDENIVAFVASGMDDSLQNDVLADVIKAALESDSCRLPSYMIPWKIHVIRAFPLTRNRKVDKKQLIVQFQAMFHKASLVDCLKVAETSTQHFLCTLFESLLQVKAVGIDCDFFDRGGHSLLVMQAVSRIREEFDDDSFTVRNFIELKTARKIGDKIDDLLKLKGVTPGICAVSNDFASRRTIYNVDDPTGDKDDEILSRVIVKTVAVLMLFISAGVAIIPFNVLLGKALHEKVVSRKLLTENALLPSKISLSETLHSKTHNYDESGFDRSQKVLSLYAASIWHFVAAYAVFYLCLTIMTIFYGYLLRKAVGKAPFTIKRSSAAYILWYVFDRLWHVTSAANSRLFGGTIFESWIYRAYGGSIGKNNFFEGKEVRLPFMLKTGDNVAVEAGAKLETLVIQKNGDIAIDQLVLGTDTVIGPNCHVGLGAKIGASCMIKSLSVIQRRQKIADSKIVTGCDVADLYSPERAGMRSFVDQTVTSLGWHVVFLWISFIPTILAYLIAAATFYLARGSPNMLKILPLCYPILRNVSQVFIAICMRSLRCLLLGRRANSCWEKVYSKSFLRRQLAKSLYQSSISTFNGTPLYNIVSRFVFGATTDSRSRFTPNIDEPDLTRIGHNVFGANGVLLRNTSFYPGGIVRYGEIEIGDKVMILDRAVVTPDTVLKKNVMVGPLTSVNEATSHDEGTLLLGTPALNLNRKAEGEGGKMGNMSLFKSILQYFIVVYFKYTVAILMFTSIFSNGIIFSKNSLLFGRSAAIRISFVICPLSILFLVASFLVISLAIKWTLIKNFSRFQSKGLIAVDSWDAFLWTIGNILIHLTCKLPLQLVNEFWLTATFWKMMGAKIGDNTKIDSDVLLYEADLLDVGDNCRIEEEATLLCHKFNEGGLKVEKVVVPSSTCIHSRAVVLPGGEICDEHVTLLPLTLLNPGEKVTKGHWQGSPAERVDIEMLFCNVEDELSSSSNTTALFSSLREDSLPLTRNNYIPGNIILRIGRYLRGSSGQKKDV